MDVQHLRVSQPFSSNRSRTAGIAVLLLPPHRQSCTAGRDVRVRTAHRDLVSIQLASAAMPVCAAHATLLAALVRPVCQTADVLENVAAFALKARLKECRLVKASVSCDTWSLLSGRVNGARILGEGWRSPLNLTARRLEVGQLAARCVAGPGPGAPGSSAAAQRVLSRAAVLPSVAGVRG